MVVCVLETQNYTTMSLLYEKLTYRIQGCIYDIHNELGTGYDEESYHLALTYKLREENIPFESKVIGYLEHCGSRCHKFVPDLIINDKVILELKNIQTNFHPSHYLQILSYLKYWKKKIGFLVNFGLPKVNSKRVIFKEKQGEFIEDYQHIRTLITPENREVLKKVRAAILKIFEIYGLGYNETIYKKLLFAEFSAEGINYAPSTFIPLKYKEIGIRNFEMKMPLISNQFICGIVALEDGINYDLIRIQTYLKDLNLPFGLLIHFGKEKLEIYGISKRNKSTL